MQLNEIKINYHFYSESIHELEFETRKNLNVKKYFNIAQTI